MKSNTFIIILYFVFFAVHFVLWQVFVKDFDTTFIKYYLFLTLLFMMVITIMSIFKKLYPDYLGFVFMGLVLFKLAMMFFVMNKLNLSEVPNYKLHFILPYLVSLTLVTFYSINLIKKDEKNQ
ncbi:MAG: hypothetical protein QM564_09990 [Bergeyella sp.]